MKPNITAVTLISEKDKARITNTLIKVKLLALVGRFANLLRWNFFSGNYQSNYSSGFLLVAGSEILYSEASLFSARKASQFRHAPQTGFSEKIENVQGKCQYRCPVSVMLPYGFIKTGLYHGYFSRNVPTFFGIFICLVSHQIIIVLIRLRKGNCHCVIEEIL